MAIVGEIEASGERRLSRGPRGLDIVDEFPRHRDFRHAVCRYDVLDRIERKLVQVARRRLELVDFRGAKAIAMRLVPIQSVHGVEREADRFAPLRPVRPGRDLETLHGHPPEACAAPLAPNPPRLIWL